MAIIYKFHLHLFKPIYKYMYFFCSVYLCVCVPPYKKNCETEKKQAKGHINASYKTYTYKVIH